MEQKKRKEMVAVIMIICVIGFVLGFTFGVLSSKEYIDNTLNRCINQYNGLLKHCRSFLPSNTPVEFYNLTFNYTTEEKG